MRSGIRGALAEAEATFRRALTLEEEATTRRPHAASRCMMLGRAVLDQGRAAEAEDDVPPRAGTGRGRRRHGDLAGITAGLRSAARSWIRVRRRGRGRYSAVRWRWQRKAATRRSCAASPRTMLGRAAPGSGARRGGRNDLPPRAGAGTGRRRRGGCSRPNPGGFAESKVLWGLALKLAVFMQSQVLPRGLSR